MWISEPMPVITRTIRPLSESKTSEMFTGMSRKPVTPGIWMENHSQSVVLRTSPVPSAFMTIRS